MVSSAVRATARGCERRHAAASGLTLTEVVRMFMTHGGRVHARCAVPLVYVSMVSSAVRATARGCERSHLDRSRKQRRRSGPRRVMCGLRSAPSLGVPRVSGVAAEVALFGRERAPPEGGGVRHSGVGNARVVSAVRPVRPVGDGEQQPAHAVVVLARRRRRLSTLSVRVMRGRYATSCRRP